MAMANMLLFDSLISRRLRCSSWGQCWPMHLYPESCTPSHQNIDKWVRCMQLRVSMDRVLSVRDGQHSSEMCVRAVHLVAISSYAQLLIPCTNKNDICLRVAEQLPHRDTTVASVRLSQNTIFSTCNLHLCAIADTKALVFRTRHKVTSVKEELVRVDTKSTLTLLSEMLSFCKLVLCLLIAPRGVPRLDSSQKLDSDHDVM